MTDTPEDKLSQIDIGICFKTNDKITSQNQASADLCGNKQAATCKDCSDKSLPEIRKKGTKLRYKIFESDVRVVLSHQKGKEEVVILSPADSDITKTILKFLKTPNLTSQEQEVLKLICEGYTNDEIMAILFISKSTLKTHINHLHQHIPDLINFRKTYL